jgi:hypothetical protein
MIRYALGTSLIALAAVVWTPARAQTSTPEPSEYQVKAAFLYNFVKFVEWPPEALARQETLVLCVFGKDPFKGALDEVVDGKTINGHPLQIRKANDPAATRSCHVLFVSAMENSRGGEITRAIRSFNILTVTEVGRSVEHCSVINFLMEDQRVRFQIDTSAAARAGLKISSKLLQLAVAAEGERARK